MPFHPDKVTEQISEWHFGHVKSRVGHQLPSFKACILATQRLRWQTRRDGIPEIHARYWPGASPADASAVAARARRAACVLSAIACIGTSPDEISNELAKWWNTSGRGLLQTGHVMGEDEEAEDASDA